MEEKRIALKLQKIKENNLTNQIIIPLFEKMGYLKVEFYGGVNEEGKDILIWDKDKMGDIHLIVAQVKHFKLNNTASSENSLQTIVNQLTTCFTKSVPYSDKSEHFPSEALLISTYEIDSKTIQTRFGTFPSLVDKKIRIIDGIKLSSLLLQYQPQIVNELIGADYKIKPLILSTLNNKILLKALGHHEEIDIKGIYTDIDFSLGKLTTKLFFNADFKPNKEILKLNEQDYYKFKELCSIIEKEFSSIFIEKSIEQIEDDYKTVYIKFTESKKILEKFKEKKVELEKLKLELNNKLPIEYRDKVLSSKAPSTTKGRIIPSSKSSQKSNTINKELNQLIKNLESTEEKIIDLILKIEKLVLETESEPHYTIPINGEFLVKLILEKRSWIESKVSEINQYKITGNELRILIEKCNSIFFCTSIILNNKYFTSIGCENDKIIRNNLNNTRITVPIERIFDTGVNITVFGEAGAGKTTSLQMYAQNRQSSEKLILWIPLSRMIQCWLPSEKEQSNIENATKLEDGIFEYLRFIGIQISNSDFKTTLKNSRIILLLDGIDEAIKLTPWLPQGIKCISEKYISNIQLIVSSRMSGYYIDEIPFFNVTLLPFTDTQRNQFIEKWFNNGNYEIVDKIKKHLINNPSLSEIVRNPLLTTTLCILAKHELPLPNSEIRLYNERISLLTGYYDNVKNIKRTNSTPINLIKFTKKLAYYLHLKGKREENYEVLKTVTVNKLSNYIDKKEAEIALAELIDPCNILVPMTDDGKYGFGHLRFQEHLAAEEINSDRSIDIIPLLTQSWWRDTLILFAQMIGKTGWILHEIDGKIPIMKVKSILAEMIYASGDKDGENLLKEIDNMIEAENKIFGTSDEDFEVSDLLYNDDEF